MNAMMMESVQTLSVPIRVNVRKVSLEMATIVKVGTSCQKNGMIVKIFALRERLYRFVLLYTADTFSPHTMN